MLGEGTALPKRPQERGGNSGSLQALCFLLMPPYLEGPRSSRERDGHLPRMGCRYHQLLDGDVSPCPFPAVEAKEPILPLEEPWVFLAFLGKKENKPPPRKAIPTVFYSPLPKEEQY